jgi:hypothetical protein
MRHFDEVFAENRKRMDKMQRTATLAYWVWTVFVLGVLSVFAGIAYHFIKRVW